MKKTGEEIYQSFIPIIDKVNVILSSYLSPDMVEDWLLDPAKGNVAFGCGKDCWAFSLRTFAQIYHKKMNCDVQKM